MSKIKEAKHLPSGKIIEVYKSVTYQTKYIDYADCNTMYDEKDLLIIGDAKEKKL
jgi:hypothetical protein